MKAELKQKWVDALRSGKYEQGRFALRRNGKFCCLGVLADIIAPDEWVMAGGNDVDKFLFRGDGSVLPRDIISTDKSNDLVGMNDDEVGLSFPKIADYIEDNIPAE